MKNLVSQKLDHSTRNEEIYRAIKESKDGLTRQELEILFEGIYGMEQISSATGALKEADEIFVMGHRINPKTNQKNEVLGLDYNPAYPKVSRKEELQNLRDELEEQKNKYEKAMSFFRAYVKKMKSN